MKSFGLMGQRWTCTKSAVKSSSVKARWRWCHSFDLWHPQHGGHQWRAQLYVECGRQWMGVLFRSNHSRWTDGRKVAKEERLCRSSSAPGNTSHTSTARIPTGASLTSTRQTVSTPGRARLGKPAAARRRWQALSIQISVSPAVQSSPAEWKQQSNEETRRFCIGHLLSGLHGARQTVFAPCVCFYMCVSNYPSMTNEKKTPGTSHFEPAK